MTTENSPIKSVETAFEITQKIIERDGASLGELSREFDQPKTTTHAYLKTLMNIGLVLNEENEYRVSSRLINLGARARNKRDLYKAAKPEVERLVSLTGHMASIMIEERGWGVTLYSHGGLSGIDIDVYPGLHSKLHTTSGGKAILAALPKSRVSEIINEHELEPRTNNTITNSDALLAELESIQNQGYAINSEERVIGMRSIGAAITDRSEDPIGALVVFGPATRMENKESQDQPSHELLLEATNIVEVNLNYA